MWEYLLPVSGRALESARVQLTSQGVGSTAQVSECRALWEDALIVLVCRRVRPELEDGQPLLLLLLSSCGGSGRWGHCERVKKTLFCIERAEGKR
jgi:hypothetical protein